MSFLTLLVLVGAAQGLVSGVLFLTKKNSILSNRFLGLILIFLSMALVNLILMEAGVRYRSSFANLLAYIFPLLIVIPVGPLLYFYIKSSVDPSFQLSTKTRIHFYPVIFDLFPYIAGLVLVAGLLTGLIIDESRWRYFIDGYNAYADIIRWGSITTYVILAIKLVKDNFSKQIVIAFASFQLIWLLHLFPYLLPATRTDFIKIITWYPIYIPLSIMIYWLSINGYLRMSVSSNKRPSPLSPTVVEDVNRALIHAMETDKLFLDPNLSVAKLAKSTGLNQKTISAFLNQHRGTSFNQFVNSYRVEELKRRLKSEDERHLTITGLGLECGFNSAATMQRAFREVEQCSPKQYQLGIA